MLDWNGLKALCGECTRCGLCQTRRNVVFGVGVEDADIMLVGEGPGEQEDLTGIPFVGPAGKLLDDMLSIIDLDRNTNCYIANIVKCRPPRNRDPLETEQDACIGYLYNQMTLVSRRSLSAWAGSQPCGSFSRITALPGSMGPGWKKTVSG